MRHQMSQKLELLMAYIYLNESFAAVSARDCGKEPPFQHTIHQDVLSINAVASLDNDGVIA